MKRTCMVRLMMIAAFVLIASAAQAWHIEGYVRCDFNQNTEFDSGDLRLSGLTLTVTGSAGGQAYTATGTTDADGFYLIALPHVPGTFTINLTPPGASSVISANPVTFSTSDAVPVLDVNFLVSSDACGDARCWLTGGGAKFSPIAQILVAEKGPQHSFGGNVNPGCNPDSGDGGNWNHVAHKLGLHFQGKSIQVERCGNVAGIPPGSTSPVTPFNFIEFTGTGTLKGVAGNKLPETDVSFFARAEDRNEPGAAGAKDGALIDRYYLRVVDGGGNVVLLIDNDGTDQTPPSSDPVTITDGNLQIHISSCEAPAPQSQRP